MQLLCPAAWAGCRRRAGRILKSPSLGAPADAASGPIAPAVDYAVDEEAVRCAGGEDAAKGSWGHELGPSRLQFAGRAAQQRVGLPGRN